MRPGRRWFCLWVIRTLLCAAALTKRPCGVWESPVWGGRCHTHMAIHCCSVSLRYSWLMGWARVRRVGWNSTTDSGRYLNQLLSFTSSSRTPPFPGNTRDGGVSPAPGGLPACKLSWPGAHLWGAGPWCSPGWRRASHRAGLGLGASLLASCRRGHKPGTEWWLAAPSVSTPELLFLHLQIKKKVF